MVKNRRKGHIRMADRLRLKEMDKVLDYADAHIEQKNFDGAVVVLHAALKQMVATLNGMDLDKHPKPDVNIYTQEDCCDGQDQQ